MPFTSNGLRSAEASAAQTLAASLRSSDNTHEERGNGTQWCRPRCFLSGAASFSSATLWRRYKSRALLALDKGQITKRCDAGRLLLNVLGRPIITVAFIAISILGCDLRAFCLAPITHTFSP